MPINVQCSSCRHALWDDAWGEYRCKKKQRSCNETELAMGCDRWEKIGSKPSDPKPEIVTRSGATFYPSVSRDGVLSWTNDKDLPNPRSIKIKGKDGVDGKDVYTPVKGVDYFDGADGKDGKDGFSPTVSVEHIEGGNRVNITDKDSTQSFDVMNGVGGESGGVSSWNDLTDKPFGEELVGISLEFDGDLTDKEYYDSGGGFYFVKMSDTPLTVEELLGRTITAKHNMSSFGADGEEVVVTFVCNEENITTEKLDESNYLIGVMTEGMPALYITHGDLSSVGVPLSEGTYFFYLSEGEEYFYTQSLSYTKSFVHKIDEKFIPNTIARMDDIPEVPTKVSELENDAGFITKGDIPESGGVTSWNDLTDKPFGETIMSDTLTWDKNIENRDKFGSNSYKVSDAMPTQADLARGGTVKIEKNGEYIETPFTVYTHNNGNSLYSERLGTAVHIIRNYNAVNGLVAPSLGIYFKHYDFGTVLSLTINGYTDFETTIIEQLDEKFIPDSVVLESELDAKGYTTEEQVMALINEAISNLPKYNGEVEDV